MPFDGFLVERGWLAAYRRTPDLVHRFLETLAWRYPSARRLVDRVFGGGTEVHTRLRSFAETAVTRLGDPAWIGAALATLCADVEIPPHVGRWIRETLIDTLEDASESEWEPDMRLASMEVCKLIAARIRSHAVAHANPSSPTLSLSQASPTQRATC